MHNDDVILIALLNLTAPISPYTTYTMHTPCTLRERHYLPRRSEEAIGAANGEMARIRQIVRKPLMSFSLMF